MDLRLSKSQLLQYLQCPFLWFLNYRKPYKVRDNTIILDNGLEFCRNYDMENTEDGFGLKHIRPEPAENTPLKIGLELHDIFDKFYSLSEAKNIEKPYEKNLYDLLMTMDNAWKYPDQIKNFANFNTQIILDKGIGDYFPVSTEQSIFNKQLNLIGILDRIDRTNNGEYSIIDYKTGKSHRVDKYLLELSLYAIIYEKETGNVVNKCGIYFSKKNKLRMTEITAQNKREALTVLQQVRKNMKKSIKNNNDFEKKYGFLCRFCDFKDICKEIS